MCNIEITWKLEKFTQELLEEKDQLSSDLDKMNISLIAQKELYR